MSWEDIQRFKKFDIMERMVIKVFLYLVFKKTKICIYLRLVG